MYSERILAIDWGYQQQSMALLSEGTITVLERDNLAFEPDSIVMYAREYNVDSLVVTGPHGMYLPDHIKEIPVQKIPRLQALIQGINFLAAASSTLILVAEVGLHLFYHGEETLYLGSLPYSFASLTLTKPLLVQDEMGCALPHPFDIYLTHSLPTITANQDSDTLLAYTIALASKEFLSRYQINHCYLAGHITEQQQSLLQAFLDKATVEALPYAMHIASTGLLVPYLETHAAQSDS